MTTNNGVPFAALHITKDCLIIKLGSFVFATYPHERFIIIAWFNIARGFKQYRHTLWVVK